MSFKEDKGSFKNSKKSKFSKGVSQWFLSKNRNPTHLLNITLNSLTCDLYSVLDNQKASKNNFQATTFKGEENSRTFQGLVQKFKDFSRLCEPWGNEHSTAIEQVTYHRSIVLSKSGRQQPWFLQVSHSLFLTAKEYSCHHISSNSKTR